MPYVTWGFWEDRQGGKYINFAEVREALHGSVENQMLYFLLTLQFPSDTVTRHVKKSTVLQSMHGHVTQLRYDCHYGMDLEGVHKVMSMSAY